MTQSLGARAAQACALASDLPSPCVSLCRMDPQQRFCEGCWRTLDEIIEWAQADDARKRAVWSQLPQRQQRAMA